MASLAGFHRFIVELAQLRGDFRNAVHTGKISSECMVLLVSPGNAMRIVIILELAESSRQIGSDCIHLVGFVSAWSCALARNCG
jgi:hypothetical protein